MSFQRIVCHLALGCAVAACYHRPERGFSRCTYVPADTLPLPEIVAATSGPVGELRVIARLRDLGSPFRASLHSADSAAGELTVTTDSVAVFRGLQPGRYSLRLIALAHASRTIPIDLPLDSGRTLTIALRYGGISMCEDGISMRGPWWRLW
jgi:hypothetical protein